MAQNQSLASCRSTAAPSEAWGSEDRDWSCWLLWHREAPGKGLGGAALIHHVCLSRAPRPLTVSQLGGTRHDRSVARRCSCLPTERGEQVLAGRAGQCACRGRIPRTPGLPPPSATFCLQGPRPTCPLGICIQSGQRESSEDPEGLGAGTQLVTGKSCKPGPHCQPMRFCPCAQTQSQGGGSDTYGQNEGCEWRELPGVFVDPLLQLQDGPRLKGRAF